MTKPRVDAAGFAVVVDPRNSKNDHIVFDVLDTQSGEGGRIVANRRPDGRLSFEVVEIGERTEFKVWKDEPLPFERWEVSPGRTLEDWRQKSTAELIDLAGDVEGAWLNSENDERGEQNKTDEPWRGELPPLGTVGYDAVTNDFAVLLRLDARDCEPAEPEDCIKSHSTYRRYLAWARFGLQPPPMAAWEGIDREGCVTGIRTGGRRRTLAAKEAGRRSLICWYSPTDEGGRAKWRLENDDQRIQELRGRRYAETATASVGAL